MIDINGFETAPVIVLIGVLAGIIESTAGGSGLIVIPVLLMLGIPPASAMATSKLQYAFGALTSITRFQNAKLIKWKNLIATIIAAAFAGCGGAFALIYTKPDILGAIIPVLLMGAVLYFIFSPRLSDLNSTARLSRLVFNLGPVLLIGFYDGFFGVGSASFYVLAMVWGLGLSAREATATTKVVDFTSSLAALLVLATEHEVLWLAGLLLGFGQIAGAWIGSGLVIKRGAQFIRPVLIVVSLGLSLKLFFDYRDVIIKFIS